MVILKNKRLDLFEATEYHDLVCRRRDHCLCTNTIVPGPSGKHMTLRAPGPSASWARRSRSRWIAPSS